jgi:hypothetical protein
MLDSPCQYSGCAGRWMNLLEKYHNLGEHGRVYGTTSTDPILALALAMAFFTPCSAILTQSYGKSIGQFWHIFA